MVTTSVTLLDRFRDPEDAEAWDRFVQLYSPLILAWIRRVGVVDSDAPDLLQEVFLTLAAKLPVFEYDPSRSFGAWLRTVTVNKCRNFAARHRQLDSLPSEQLPGDEDGAELFELQEYRSYVAQRALLLMKNEFQTTTWQACWETVVSERPAAEVADALGITVNAVYLARGRVLRRLREQLHGLWG